MGFFLLWALCEKVIRFVYFSCNQKISEKVSKANLDLVSTFHIITIFSSIDFLYMHVYWFIKLAFLETFWDSDEPKFGESEAKGWNHWMNMKEKGGWQQTATSSSE